MSLIIPANSLSGGYAVDNSLGLMMVVVIFNKNIFYTY
jgi:hypothetical protein